MPSDTSRVNVHSKLTVVSSTPVGPGKTHPLTALDHAMGGHTLHMIFYYRTIRVSGSFDLDQLRASLSQVLSQCPAVTGRLTRSPDGNWEVKCNDAGVRILKARVGATLDEWLRSSDEAEERDLTAWEDMPEDPYIWSPFRIQINDFEGGGLAIGLSCTHLLADPTSAILLLKSWADTHRGEPMVQSPSFHPATLSQRATANKNPRSALSYVVKAGARADPSVKMATATFRFSNLKVKQCLSEVHAKCPNATPFDALAALFWTRITKLKAPALDSKHRLCLCLDMRKLKQAKLPTGYFGNALHFSLLSLDAKKLEISDVGHVEGLVRRHVFGLEEDVEEVWSGMDWLEREKAEEGKYAPPFRVYGPLLTCMNMEDLVPPSSLYAAAMFEKDEKPAHISCRVGNVGGEGLILVMPSPEEGLGRTVAVTLPEEQLGKLCEDEAILHLEPTMLLSGRK